MAEQGKGNERPDLTAEEVEERVRTQAEIAQVLDRGMTVERLDVRHLIPTDRVGIFVRNRAASIARMKGLGFRVEKFSKETLRGMESHDSADGTYVVGDVLLMTTSRQNYDGIQAVYKQRSAGKLEQSRRDFRAAMGREGVPAILDREV